VNDRPGLDLSIVLLLVVGALGLWLGAPVWLGWLYGAWWAVTVVAWLVGL
jgi:hypothetical protein